MSYTALYRKWRPVDFHQVVGQDPIVRTLSNQIKASRIGHAYLFCGTRGTGKTTLAKIFARAINCQAPVEGNPCNRCPVCRNLLDGKSMNVIEMDAASNNGVDNIREIREDVRYTPTEGKYKVYIIDEVHMLSTGAFNALLKTLEEPPPHVVFILATTDPHKIPPTILSRCQRYDLRRIPMEVIAHTLAGYMVEEGIGQEEKAIRYVARVADGSMRDALSILDQCIAFYIGESITFEKVLEVLGAVDSTVFMELVESIHQQDARAALDLLDRVVMQGRDLVQFLVDLLTHLRNMLVVKNMPQAQEALDLSAESQEAIRQAVGDYRDEEIMHLVQAFSDLEGKVKGAAAKRVLIEIEVLRLCRKTMDSTPQGLLDRIGDLEKRMAEGVPQAPPPVRAPKEPKEGKAPVKKERTVLPEAYPEDIRAAISHWGALVDRTEAFLKAALRQATPLYLEGDQNQEAPVLTVLVENETQKNILSQEEYLGTMIRILEELHKKRFQVAVVDEKDYMARSSSHSRDTLEEAKSVFEELSSKINFTIEVK
ncbi:DNA polymerase III subunit gamma/tau [Anaerotalea alkaliphila]|uniref:DNA-directed DNA polymerase n=1 Tax=Anaerotalea alkaliphila TaxID=2662126 RepID=A0A7X5HTH5_9FIRM|nr:DNA polymerase III subunit gamma/tau [Anaerotalea alkaliphila]